MSNNSGPAAMINTRAGYLLETLPDGVVRKLLHDFLQKQLNKAPEHVDTFAGVMFRIAGTSVYVKKSEVTVEMGPFRAKEAAVWQREITKLLTRAAGLLFQQQVRNVIVENYKIEQEQKSSNGAIVMVTELLAEQTAIEAKIAIFPDGRIAIFTDISDPKSSKEPIALLLCRLKEKELIEKV